jgi:oligoendopeptidase F
VSKSETVMGFVDLPEWDLSDLYKGSNDPKITTELDDLTKRANTFVAKYKDIFTKTFKGNDLYKAIVEYENISEGFSKLMSFAGLQYYSDLNNADFRSLYQSLQEKISNISSQLVFFTLDLAKIKEADLKNAIQEEPKLSKYNYWLEVVGQYQPHQLSEEVERYTVEKSVTGRNAWVRLYDETLASMQFNFEGEKLPLEAITNKMSHKSRDVRKKAAETLSKGLSAQLPLFTTVTNVLAKDKEIDDKWRKFKNPDSSRHLDNQIEPEVVAALVNAVSSNYSNLSHRYYGLKAKMLGLSKLEYWDRNAPPPLDDEDDISWPVARKIVLDAYSAFSPTIANIAQEFFDKNWIDVPNKAGKTSGAFSHPTVPSAHPYVLLNYLSRRRDVMTLAHELGHGVHQMLAREQGYLLADTPLTLAETASVFGEMLTFQHLLKTSKTKQSRQALLAGKIDDMLNTVVRQIAFYLFEQQVHEARKSGELSSDDLAAIWQRTQTQALGPNVNIDPITHNFWAYISHFIHTPFYVYAYAFGDCLVNSLYAFYIKNPDGFETKYLNLLKSGGSQHYSKLMQPFGFDLSKADFWNGGLKMIADMIDELEQSM